MYPSILKNFRGDSSPFFLGGGHCPISPFITESILSVLRNWKNTNSIRFEDSIFYVLFSYGDAFVVRRGFAGGRKLTLQQQQQQQQHRLHHPQLTGQLTTCTSVKNVHCCAVAAATVSTALVFAMMDTSASWFLFHSENISYHIDVEVADCILCIIT